MGNLIDFPAALPGYSTVIPKSGGTIAEILKRNGYGTAMFGKGHITPSWEKTAAGPFDRWPTGLGFEYYYGFLDADTSQFAPRLVENTKYVEPLAGDASYHLDKDLTDHAIAWLTTLRLSASEKPFFIYYAPGAAHAPNHAPPEWLEKFRGKFDDGWDRARVKTFERQKALGIIPADAKLTPRDNSIPSWDSLDHDHKRVAARMMEAYAASLAYSDFQIGRLIDHLRDTGQLQNTLVIFIQGDNGGDVNGGSDGELFERSLAGSKKTDFAYTLQHIDDIGGPKAYNLYPAGWGWAMNAPFPWYKKVASQAGGVRNGMVVSWPKHITTTGEIRTQYTYIADVMPTILDAAGIAAPAMLNDVPQQPLDGISFKYSFSAPGLPSRRHMQIYEMMGNFGIYHDGWMAGVLPQHARQHMDPKQRAWQLFDLERDFSTATDLAKSNPGKLGELQKLFWSEATRQNILPIHDRLESSAPRPLRHERRNCFSYPQNSALINEEAAPPILGHSFSMETDIDLPANVADGVLIAHGGRFGGYALYLKDNKIVFHYNDSVRDQYRIGSNLPLRAGNHHITVYFHIDTPKRGSGGVLTISVDGDYVARGRIPKTISGGWLSFTEGFDVGHDAITPVSDDYNVENSRFHGLIKSMNICIL
jgi:arylsulfatase